MTPNIDRNQLVQVEAAMNQSRNMIYHLIRFMKKNDVENVKERLREMGKNIARTFYNYWKPIESVDIINIKDVIATIYKKILNSSITIEVDEINKLIIIKDSKCALCKYHYEDVGKFAGCEVILGMLSELVELINKNSNIQSKISIKPLEVRESRAYGDDACVQVFNYQ
ncbi:MAG: hypothetical protein ACFFBP_22830 [Promethearchaeota archaeon]